MRPSRKEPEERALVSMDETYGFITSVVAPVYNSNGDPVALVGVDISMPGVWQSMQNLSLQPSINIVLVISGFQRRTLCRGKTKAGSSDQPVKQGIRRDGKQSGIRRGIPD